MKNTFHPNQNDDIFWDVQIEPEDIIVDKNDLDRETTLSEEVSPTVTVFQRNYQHDREKKPFAWKNITQQRLNIFKKKVSK